jgi:integrase
MEPEGSLLFDVASRLPKRIAKSFDAARCLDTLWQWLRFMALKARMATLPDRRLRPGEFERLMKAAAAYRNPTITSIIQLAIATGMRRGEILSIEQKHINFSKRTLVIPLSKNGHSRTIPLSLEAIAALSARHPSGERLFSIKGDALRLAWNRIVRRATIKDLRFHDLRHEAISRFFELGLTIPEVASRAGPGCLNRISALMSGASAAVRPPSGMATG